MLTIRSILAIPAAIALALPAAAQQSTDSTRAADHAEVRVPPRLLNGALVMHTIARTYPPPLREARIEGVVQVTFLVEPDGRVHPDSIRVEESTHEAFNDPTLEVARRMRFAPATIDGAPVRVRISLPVRWSIH